MKQIYCRSSEKINKLLCKVCILSYWICSCWAVSRNFKKQICQSILLRGKRKPKLGREKELKGKQKYIITQKEKKNYVLEAFKMLKEDESMKNKVKNEKHLVKRGKERCMLRNRTKKEKISEENYIRKFFN